MNLLLFTPALISICVYLEYSAGLKKNHSEKYSNFDKSIKKYFNKFSIACAILGIIQIIVKI